MGKLGKNGLYQEKPVLLAMALIRQIAKRRFRVDPAQVVDSREEMLSRKVRRLGPNGTRAGAKVHVRLVAEPRARGRGRYARANVRMGLGRGFGDGDAKHAASSGDEEAAGDRGRRRDRSFVRIPDTTRDSPALESQFPVLLLAGPEGLEAHKLALQAEEALRNGPKGIALRSRRDGRQPASGKPLRLSVHKTPCRGGNGSLN